MTANELKDKLTSEKHFTGSLQIIFGEKIASPNILGIYEENGVWHVYDTNDRGGIAILDSGSEADMADALYRRILKAEKRYMQK